MVHNKAGDTYLYYRQMPPAKTYLNEFYMQFAHMGG